MNVVVRLKELLLKDLWFKLLALALALVTWLYIDAELHQRTAPPFQPPDTLTTLSE